MFSTHENGTAVEYLKELGIWLKRDDLYTVAGVSGGKVRACSGLIHTAISNGGIKGVITAGARQSPQIQIVAHLANAYGIRCRAHTACGDYTPELKDATNYGCKIIQHKPGYNSVICSRAMDDAKASPGWLHIPFGMESPGAVQYTRKEARLPAVLRCNTPIKRIVVPVGSGMTVAGILHGLCDIGWDKIPVIGVCVGADAKRRLNRYAPPFWHQQLTLVDATKEHPYHAEVVAWAGTVLLDPIYEAKAWKYVQQGDLFWIVGIRAKLGE